MSRAHHILWLGALLAVLFHGTALAQVTTGTIKGEVVSTDDAPVEGTVVRIESPTLMGVRNATSDAAGRFRFPGLPPGPYTLTAEKEGFKTLIRRGLVVETGRTVNLKLVMDLPEMGETVEIIDRRPAVDTEQTDIGETVSSEFLGELPTGRSFQEVIQFLPGVTGGANPNVHGATYTSNQYYVDGVNTTDPVTNTFSMNFNFDAIQDIQVVTGAFDAKYGQALGGVINITTKSGGNKFEGDFSVYYTTSALQSHDRYIQEDIQEIDSIELNGMISGPIVKDHLWFLVSYQYTHQDWLNMPALDTGRDLSKYPILPHEWRSHYLFGKLTWQISYANKLTLSAQADPTVERNGDRGNIYALQEAQYDWFQGGWYVNLTWDWTPSAYTMLRTQAYLQKSFIRFQPVQWRDCTDWDPETRECLDDSLQATPHWPAMAGGFYHTTSGRFYNDRRWNFAASVDFTAFAEFLGTHQFDLGADLQLVWNDYYFNYPTHEIIYDMPTDGNGNGIIDDEELNDLDSYVNDSRYVIVNQDDYRITGRKLSFYAQDVWKPWSNLTLRPGVRLDTGVMKNNLGDNILDFVSLSPRLNLSWDPANDRKTRVYGGYNRFVDSGFLWISDFISRSELNSEYYTWDAGNHRWNTDGSRAGTPSVNLTHYDLVPPSVDEVNVGIEREIQKDLAAGVTYIHREFHNPFEDDEVNLLWNEDGTNIVGSRSGSDNYLWRLRTPGTAYRQYDAVEFTLRKNLSDNLQFVGNYTWSRSAGNYIGPSLTSDYDHPQQVYYQDGLLPIDRPHVIKMQGTYDNPGRIKISDVFSLGYGFGFIFTLQAGTPYNKYYWNSFWLDNYNLHDRRGSQYRLPATSTLDLRGNVKLSIKSIEVDLVILVTNLLNSREVVAVDERATDSAGDVLVDDKGQSVFSRPIARQFPRQVQFGLRVHF